ncbi:conserved hypothetical protein [Sporisorium reilianum SRZ2]|uniref:Elongator complex protein 4 n=1 Tax=Sporisorium reilianum (strain SRZ2) TaxID=999809 RepID=E6ZLE3_SPORE|nr:conserved hypothetical protein [Sporisorium reilianum SRZ2]
MSSFKRRVHPSSGAATPAPLPAGVKPSSFSSPVPLISTGVPALDDLLSGGGLSSSSDLLLLPATGTAAQSAAQIGASSSTPAASAETDHAARAAAEPYVELLLGYSVAQGLASGHVGVVVGEDVSGLVGGLMARAGDLDERVVARIGGMGEEAEAGPSELLGAVGDDDDADGTETARSKPSDAQREREMKIAWRYHNMKQFNTTVNEPSSSSSSSEPSPFCHTFDLSKRIDSRIIQHAVEQGKLDMVDISTATQSASSSRQGTNTYELAYTHIEAAAERCRRQAASTPTAAPPVLRVAIRALGSPAWTVARGQSQHTETIRFLHRLKRLLRSLSLVDTSATSSRAIPSIAVISVSSFLLSSPSGAANLAHRMVHSVDAAIAMSAFASSSALRAAFAAYTGALKVLKTPAVGTLTNPSVRSSVLRGMGTGAGAGNSAGSSGGGGEGGAGGGENNLAFKVRRKRLVIETLHLDVEGGVSERRTKPPKSEATGAKTTTAAQGVAKPNSAGGSSFVRRLPAAAPVLAEARSAPAEAAAPKKFAGLASLRQRGLAAAAAASGQQQQREYAVEVDSARSDTHQHSHARQAPRAQNRVANARAEDLEF